MPRNAHSALKLKVERAILPQLDSRTKIEIPRFIFKSEDDDQVSYVGYKMITGTALTIGMLKKLSKTQLANVSNDIGRFLTTLHSFTDLESLKDLEVAESSEEKWADFRIEVIEKTGLVLSQAEKLWINRLFDDFLTNPRTFNYQPTLIHSDFTSDHILFNEEHQSISGVIDFGDVEIGDPAFDFAGICTSYGRDFMKMVLENYNREIDDGFINRIDDFYVKQVPLHGLIYGIENNNELQIKQSVSYLHKFMKNE